MFARSFATISLSVAIVLGSRFCSIQRWKLSAYAPPSPKNVAFLPKSVFNFACSAVCGSFFRSAAVISFTSAARIPYLASKNASQRARSCAKSASTNPNLGRVGLVMYALAASISGVTSPPLSNICLSVVQALRNLVSLTLNCLVPPSIDGLRILPSGVTPGVIALFVSTSTSDSYATLPGSIFILWPLAPRALIKF